MTSLGKHQSCRTATAIYCDRNHIKDQPRAFLGSVEQFCAAFYHVPQRITRGIIAPHCCLNEHQCIIGQRMRSEGLGVHPRTVVAVIKCEDRNGIVVYEARYSNCYDDKMHAEDYFRLDAERGTLQKFINLNKVNTITMYITFQPCNMTVKDTLGAREDHSCCETILALFPNGQFLIRRDIEIRIKPTHLYKVYRNSKLADEEQNVTKNAVEGIKMLMKSGIEVSRMDESDWEYLSTMVGDRGRHIVPDYQGSKRETLDIEIGEALRDLHIDVSVEQPLLHNCDTGFAIGIYDDRQHSMKRQNTRSGSFLGKPGQVCAAFYHIHDGQQPLPSKRFFCLENLGCLSSGKYRKLKGFYDPPKTMVAVVKCEADDGIVLYEARYTDCYSIGVSAEEFFARDARKGELRKIIDGRSIRRITLYAAWPPRHFASQSQKPHHSCCVMLVELYSNLLKPRQIMFSVKLVRVHKEGWPQYEDDVQLGIKILIGNGIVVSRMMAVDWEYLVCSLAGLKFTSWDWQPRRMLDEMIGQYLAKIERDIHEWKAALQHICSLQI